MSIPAIGRAAMMSEIDDLKTMFKSGNDVPVTRVTITLEQFERICEMFKNQHDSGLAVIKENQQLRFDNTELVQERDRLCITVKDLSGAMLSVNRSRNQKIMIEGDDEPITKYVELTREQAFEHLKTNSLHH